MGIGRTVVVNVVYITTQTVGCSISCRVPLTSPSGLLGLLLLIQPELSSFFAFSSAFKLGGESKVGSSNSTSLLEFVRIFADISAHSKYLFLVMDYSS